MRVAALIFAAGLMLAAPALAQTDPSPPPPASSETTTETGAAETPEATTEQASASSEQEEICRTVQRTESRLRARRERICGTRAEWEQMERDAADVVRGNGVQGRAGN